MKALAQKGVAVYALVGATEWGFEEDGASLTGALEAVAEYNLQVSGEGRIAGVMEDVEPLRPDALEGGAGGIGKAVPFRYEESLPLCPEAGLVSIACIPAITTTRASRRCCAA